MSLDDAMDDGQSQAAALDPMARTPEKTLEEVWQVVGRNADTRIGDL